MIVMFWVALWVVLIIMFNEAFFIEKKKLYILCMMPQKEFLIWKKVSGLKVNLEKSESIGEVSPFKVLAFLLGRWVRNLPYF